MATTTLSAPTIEYDATPEPEFAPRPVAIAPRRVRPLSLYDSTFDELADRLVALGAPAYRAAQIFDWAYRHLAADYGAMTNLPATLRKHLAETLPLSTLGPVREQIADGGETVKTLYRTIDGHFVETVLMFYPDRVTVCVSCQVGCAVGCAFCATGLGGLGRNLTAGEMVAQTVDAARGARARGRTLSNVVMMGMGEPFQNYAETMRFVRVLHEPKGFNLGARRITISTSGIVPKIDALAEEPFQVNLAVSLHAPNDELRDRLVPINRRWPIADLLAACRRYVERTGRRVSFEYALMAGINSDDAIAEELTELLDRSGVLCHVNVIPYNPVEMLRFERPTPDQIDRFAAILRAGGLPTTVRYSRGLDIGAACGQLSAQQQAVLGAAPRGYPPS
jgi:23S rRNA (adenine2503-C2)-methyltransferase